LVHFLERRQQKVAYSTPYWRFRQSKLPFHLRHYLLGDVTGKAT